MKLLNILKRFMIFPLSLLPLRKNLVLFESFNGQYNDNPKYISEKLHEMDKSAQIAWCVSKKCNETVPPYVKKVNANSLSLNYYESKAKVVVDNMMGYNILSQGHKIPLSGNFVKKKGQLNVSTWHGTPVKKIGADIKNSPIANGFYTSSDYMIAGCNYTKEILQKAFLNAMPVKLTGTPRNDPLINMTDNRIKEVKEMLNLPIPKKIVLFAPTFRDHVNESGVSQMQQFNFTSIFNALHEKFGGEWIFVFRVHHEVLKEIDTHYYEDHFPGQIIDGNSHDDMAEYLMCADVLITDYSGSMHDFALTGRPCFLYAPDRAHYENIERGFYIDFDSLPFPTAYQSEELVHNILLFDEAEYKKKIFDFLSDIGNVEDGKASERISQDILDFIYKGTISKYEN